MNYDEMVKDLTEAAKDQPLATCDICKKENIPCFLGHPLTPSGEDLSKSKFICLQCFLNIGMSAESPRKRRSYRPPRWIQFILMNPRVFFTMSSVFVAVVSLFACITELVRNKPFMAVAFAVLTWAILYLSTARVDQWHKDKQDQHQDHE